MQPKAADFDRLTLLPARIEEARKPSVGTPIVRPSDNSTHIESSSNLTAWPKLPYETSHPVIAGLVPAIHAAAPRISTDT